MIRKLLIANRGEIAIRVIHAARELGVRTVAVYSDADAAALHVQLADEAVHIGPPEPAASYLDIEKILDAARQTGADAIHPGYGFLSEREEFAQACADANIIFVGPSAEAMRKLGAKIDAKKLAVAAGVPVTPGFFEKGASADELLAASKEIGFPVMLKASAGGGGRGMRIVREEAAFMQELATASDEALKAFGDGAMMVEKLIERPRHIEVQILADRQGNVAALFERECSVQRRHQKLLEEAGSPVLLDAPELWPTLRDACVRLIQAASYEGAGTIEFMFDSASREFYFLEVNARLQVEHPVTELVTGIDLVQWQLRVASGERLDLGPALMGGERSALKGHSIEARVVAEDPARNFLPSVGPILAWAEPKAPGIRIDSGYGPGAEVPRYYDSLLAKVIAYGETREQALDRLILALEDFHVLGVKTNIEFLLAVCRHPEFRKANLHTAFLEDHFAEWQPSSDIPPELASMLKQAPLLSGSVSQSNEPTPVGAWAQDGFRNARS
jgi:acetyl/propionyl-CoA carboxylase alpha subunit